MRVRVCALAAMTVGTVATDREEKTNMSDRCRVTTGYIWSRGNQVTALQIRKLGVLLDSKICINDPDSVGIDQIRKNPLTC